MERLLDGRLDFALVGRRRHAEKILIAAIVLAVGFLLGAFSFVLLYRVTQTVQG